jgi:hypothetical protein
VAGEFRHRTVDGLTKSEYISGQHHVLNDAANGDFVYYEGGVLKRLPVGSNGQVLKSISGYPGYGLITNSGLADNCFPSTVEGRRKMVDGFVSQAKMSTDSIRFHDITPIDGKKLYGYGDPAGTFDTGEITAGWRSTLVKIDKSKFPAGHACRIVGLFENTMLAVTISLYLKDVTAVPSTVAGSTFTVPPGTSAYTIIASSEFQLNSGEKLYELWMDGFTGEVNRGFTICSTMINVRW